MTVTIDSTGKRTITTWLAIVFATSFALPAAAAVINVPADQPTIQDAVNAANPDDEIVIADGFYSESVNLDTMSVPGNLTIRAATVHGATLDGVFGPALYATGFPANITFQDLRLNAFSGIAGGIVNFVDLGGVLLVENCEFISGFGGDGVHVETTGTTQTNVEIRNSTFDSPADNRDAISVELFGTTNLVDLTATGNTFTGLKDDGISFRADPTATGGEMRALITGNQFSNRTASGEDIELFFGNNLTTNLIASATVENNTLVGPRSGTGASGEAVTIDVDGTATTATVNITNNTISEYADDGIFVDSDSTAQGTTLDLLIDNNNLTFLNGSGIVVRPFDGNMMNTTVWNMTVTNNTVTSANQDSSPTNAGIEFDTNSTQADYIANIVLNNNTVTSTSPHAYLFDQANASEVNLDQNLSTSLDPRTVVIDNLNAGVPVEIRGTVNVVVITPQVRVDIDVSTTESIDPVIAGSGTGNLVYVVTVTNNGPDDATGVELSELLTLPAAVTIDSIVPSGSTSFSAPTWTIGNLAATAGETLTITLTAGPSAASGVDVITSSAAVTAVNEIDSDSGNDASVESTSVTREIDLQLTKIESIDPVSAGSGPGNLSYVVTVANAGPSDATGIAIAEALTLPAGVSVDSITPSVGTFSDPTWTVGDLPTSAFATLTVVLTVSDSTTAGTDVISDTAVVVSVNETDTNPANDAATESTSVVRQVDLAVTKTESADPVTAGSGVGNLVHVVTVTNNGPAAASGVALTDTLTLPAGLSVDSITPSLGSFSDPTWTVGSLAVGASETLTVVLTVDASTVAGTDVIGDTAAISAVNETDTNASNDTATEATSVARVVDLSVTKTESADPVTAGSGAGNLVYIVTVTNSGPSDASGIAITEALTLPAGTSLDSATPSAGSYTDPTWTLGTLAVGASETLTVVLSVGAATAPGTDVVGNTASVTAVNETDSNSGNDSATEATSVSGEADLGISKTDSPDPVTAGSQLVYTVEVTNAGPSDAFDVVVTDTLPAGVTLVSTSGCAEDPSGIPTCSLGTVATGGTVSFTITVDIDPSVRGILSNTATVASSTIDPNAANDSATEDTTAEALVDLILAKDAAPEPLPAGQDLIYTLTVSNDGPSDATNVVVTDTLPAGVTLISTSGCAEDPNGVPTCSLGNIGAGGSKQYTITVSVDPSPPPTITNTASVTSTEPEANPVDNSDDATTTLDTVPPLVAEIDTIPARSDGSLDECDDVLERVSTLLITFSEAMSDPPGDSDPDDVTNPANYLVVGAGADGEFSTDTCGPVVIDDVLVIVESVTYDAPSMTARLHTDLLPSSQVRVMACGSTSLVDLAGNPLDGNGNGVGGDDFVVTFRSDPSNEFSNAHLDCAARNLDGWSVSDPVEFTRTDEDVDGSSISGSIQIMQLGSNTTFELSQCVPTFGEATYDFSVEMRMITPSLLSFSRKCEFFLTPMCGIAGTGLAVNVSTDLIGDTGGAWIPIAGAVDTPAGTQSARCGFSFSIPGGQDFTANLDDLFFGASSLIFTDGFESGDDSAWSASVP